MKIIAAVLTLAFNAAAQTPPSAPVAAPSGGMPAEVVIKAEGAVTCCSLIFKG